MTIPINNEMTIPINNEETITTMRTIQTTLFVHSNTPCCFLISTLLLVSLSRTLATLAMTTLTMTRLALTMTATVSLSPAVTVTTVAATTVAATTVAATTVAAMTVAATTATAGAVATTARAASRRVTVLTVGIRGRDVAWRRRVAATIPAGTHVALSLFTRVSPSTPSRHSPANTFPWGSSDRTRAETAS